MKLTLTAINSKYIHSNLALRYLRAYFNKNADEKVKSSLSMEFVEGTINDNLDAILERIVLSEPDVVLFSTYIWNFYETKEIIRNLRDIRPNIIIICGGPEVSFESSRHIKEMEVDYIIKGEGEESFTELISSLVEGKDVKNIKGIDYVKDGVVISNEARQPMDINELVFPYDEEELINLKNRIVYYEASRGCPFRCSYCMSSLDKLVRTLDIKRVKRELKFFMEKKVPLVKFVDRTFNTDRKFSYEVWEYIINERNKNRDYVTKFHFEVSGALITEDQVELLRKSPIGLIQLEAGVQTTDRIILDNINRYDSFERLKDMLTRIIEKGNIHVHVDLIAGLPGDTIENFKKSFNECFSLKAHMLQLGFLKVLKGTEIFSSIEKWGIKYRRRQPYEVLKTSTMSYEDLLLLKRVEEVVEKFWNSGLYSYSMRILTDVADKKSVDSFSFFLRLSDELEAFKKIKANLKRDDYFDVLLSFNKRQGFLEEDILKELLTFDLIISDRRGNILESLDKEKVTTRRVTLEYEDIVKSKSNSLKGTVNEFKIDVVTLVNSKVVTLKESYIFYSLNFKEIYLLEKNDSLDINDEPLRKFRIREKLL